MASHLSDELVSKFTNEIDTYSVDDFKKEVYAASVECDASIFSKKEEPDVFYKGAHDALLKSAAKDLRDTVKKKNGGNR